MDKIIDNNQNANHALDRRTFLKTSVAVSALASTFPFTLGNEQAFAADPASDIPEVGSSPYGVCAHVGGGEEWAQAPQNLKLMKEAGIVWVRADFSWIGVENPQGKWHFDHLDKIVGETNELGMQLLPILNYDVSWATPAYKHMDAWLEYVRRTVERYRDRLRYWEIWNEENLQGFWRDTPSGADYATLLRETYKTIKEIDPELIVVYGGLAGVPCDYFEASLDAGAGEFFDVVNIHPYRGGMTSKARVEKFASDVDAFRQALKKRNLAPRPIWITEMGWATPPVFGEANRRVVTGALKKLFPNDVPKVAFFYDERYDPAVARSREDFVDYLPEEYVNNSDLTVFLNADELKKIDLETAKMLIMPPSETFPTDCFSAIVEYVKKGGTLVLMGGVPLYYESKIDESKRYRQIGINPNFGRDLNALRISWFAWWTRDNVPKETPTIVAPESADVFPGYFPVHPATRFFDDAALKEGDKMIPLLNGKTEEFFGTTACVYDFNSDYKGAVVLSAITDDDGANTNRSTVPNQAVFLTQSYLLAFANGIERYFWYEFQAPQRDLRDPEHHFGIVGQKLDPKPGYYAYKALTQARPAGSLGDELTLRDDLCVVSWKRPDGQKAWAIWAPLATREATLKIEGKVAEAFDYLGNDVAKPEDGSNVKIATGALYLVGPQKIEVL